MTYEQLATKIAGLSPEQKLCDVTVFLQETDEYVPVQGDDLDVAVEENGVVDGGHPILTVNV